VYNTLIVFSRQQMASSSVSLDERKAELQALATASAKAAEDSAAKLRGEDARLKTLRESLNKEKLQVEQSKAEVIVSFVINVCVCELAVTENVFSLLTLVTVASRVHRIASVQRPATGKADGYRHRKAAICYRRKGTSVGFGEFEERSRRGKCEDGQLLGITGNHTTYVCFSWIIEKRHYKPENRPFKRAYWPCKATPKRYNIESPSCWMVFD
jgi:hypothetical protein